MKNNNIAFYFKTAAVLTVIASLTALMLAVVNGFTADRIAENLRTATNDAIAEIFTEGKTFEKIDSEYTLPVTDIWLVAGNDGKNIGYCIFVTVKGFKENIDFVVGADTAGKCIGIKIIASAETAGLGSLISDAGYTAQYIGKAAGMTLNNEIDAISGATISSRALLEGVNAALASDIIKSGNTSAVPQDTAANGNETDGTEGGASDGQVTEQP